MKAVKDVETYIASFPKPVQAMMQQLRKTIKAEAPEAEETISYQMPAYKYHGALVYFAAYEHHVGFYPTGTGIAAFEKELADYKYSKGAVQFPLDKPLPLDLVKRMVRFKMKENMEKAALKKKK